MLIRNTGLGSWLVSNATGGVCTAWDPSSDYPEPWLDSPLPPLAIRLSLSVIAWWYWTARDGSWTTRDRSGTARDRSWTARDRSWPPQKWQLVHQLRFASLSVRRCCHTVTLEFQPTRRLSLYFCNIQGKTVGIVTYKTMLFHWNSRALLTVGTVDSRHCCQSALLKNRHCPANGFWHCPENDSRHCPQKDSRHCPQNDSRSCVQVTVVSVRH